MDTLWSEVLKEIKSEINVGSFDTWFSQTEPIDFRDGKLLIGVPDKVCKAWLNEHYSSAIHDIISNLGREDVQVLFEVLEKKGEPRQVYVEDTAVELPVLNPRYTFSNFVVGSSNQLAHAAALAVAENPASSYNPLFIYGGPGLGKTHLMHAIGHYVIEKNPRSKVVYLSSEEFTNDLIKSIRFDETVQFRAKYRSVDLLLIDDIQFIAGKERTQEEFFHTFNALYEAHKQLIISSDAPPKEIPTIEERLRSRFGWGLTADVQPPDLETKIAILRKKAEKCELALPDDVSFFIASKTYNVRDLEGSLNRVMAVSSLSGRDVTMALAQEALKDMLRRKEKQLSIEAIQKIVADFYSIKVPEMKSKKRSRELAFPRQVAMFLCRELTKSSLPHIGKDFGNRDHTTVLHACDKISTLIKSDSSFKEVINHLKISITS